MPDTGPVKTDKMLSRKEGSIGYMIFNNPERHNAVSLDMWRASERILEDFKTDADIRVVVLTGAGGKAFVSGADISKFESERASQEAVAIYNATVARMYAGLYEYPKPTIAMIRGYCVGGGLGLAVACDMRFCSDNARFALPAAKLGLGYEYTSMKRCVDLVGPSFTKEIFMSAKQYDAADALRMGLANRVLPDAELEAQVKEFAGIIAANAPLTVASIKAIVTETLKDPGDRDLKRCSEMVQRCFASNDYIEGRRAFMEKRTPKFTGN